MIYKYYSSESSHAVPNFRDQVVCFSHVSQFNDDQEFFALFEKSTSLQGTPLSSEEDELIFNEIEAVKFQIRVFCACKSADSVKLWNDYANHESGFCLEYDENDFNGLSDKVVIQDVEYSDICPTLSGNADKLEQSVLSQIFHKFTKCEDENEIRIVLYLPISSIQIETAPIPLSNIPIKLDKEHNLITYCPLIPTNHLTRSNNELPLFEKRIAPLNIIMKVIPRKLIIGKNCAQDYRKELKRIAHEQGIPVEERERDK